MIVFVTSDKGGTGRSVTSCNILYRLALQGVDVCYVDFDFGSPTSGAIFEIDAIAGGTTPGKGLHSYLAGAAAEPQTLSIWKESERSVLRRRPAGAGQMTLMPGDAGGAEFLVRPDITGRCADLFGRLEEEYEISLVDLSAGRSYALQMALEVTTGPQAPADVRWLVFHRWTQQHVTAAHGLVYRERGILDIGKALGHHPEALLDRLRFVRTAVIDANSPDLSGLRPSQVSWLRKQDEKLHRLANQLRLGLAMRLGSVPLDPMLQWKEQLITSEDQYQSLVANAETVEALEDLARRLRDKRAWERV